MQSERDSEKFKAFKCAVLTMSDRCSRNEYKDESGKIIAELIAGIGTPISTAATTTRRHAAWAFSMASLKNGASRMFVNSWFLSNASLIFPRKTERIMQPPRHIRAMPP